MVRKSTTKQPCVEVAEVDPSTTKNRINAIKIGATLFTSLYLRVLSILITCKLDNDSVGRSYKLISTGN